MSAFTSKIYLTLALALFSAGVYSQQYVPAARGCKVEFKLTSHRDSEPQVIKGRLTGLRGKINFDPKSLGTASFDITLSAGSITTGIAQLDKVIKNVPFLNPAKYPLIRLKSKSVTKDGPGSIYTLQGNLTINGVTKPVHIQFMATPGDGGYLFRGGLEMSRLAFLIGSKEDKTDDNVSVFIEVRTSKK